MKKLVLPAVLSLVLSYAIASTPEAATGKSKDCKLKIGDTYAGGIVFYLQPGSDDCHGLVCAPTDQGTNTEWKEAVSLCNTLTLDGYSDWRLPTMDELNQMYMNLYKDKLGGFATQYYWSSTVDNTGLAYAQYFCHAYDNVYRFVYKYNSFNVRAVRAF